jgi:DNA-binding LacI/PurR family transcriptional regulator
MPTIKDVARRAGVSTATVSNVINQRGNVSPKLTKAVNQAIEELDYRPNVLARGLRANHSRTIGLVISDISNPYFAGIAAGVERVCSRRGYTTLFCTTNDSQKVEAAQLLALRDRQVDGIILGSTGAENPTAQELVSQGFPIVLVNRRLENVETDSVCSDNLGGARQVISHLLSLGHRRIAFIAGVHNSLPSIERLRGYHLGLSEAGLPVNHELTRYGYLKYSGGYDACKSLLQIEDPPTAIFASNDMMAIGAMDAAIELGLRIPEDISLIGLILYLIHQDINGMK